MTKFTSLAVFALAFCLGLSSVRASWGFGGRPYYGGGGSLGYGGFGGGSLGGFGGGGGIFSWIMPIIMLLIIIPLLGSFDDDDSRPSYYGSGYYVK